MMTGAAAWCRAEQAPAQCAQGESSAPPQLSPPGPQLPSSWPLPPHSPCRCSPKATVPHKALPSQNPVLGLAPEPEFCQKKNDVRFRTRVLVRNLTAE
eukprot:scaffold31_cov263-Pinguiococcus_pyrenoidosus.AAC.35